jgi:wyosine [tRNA(Phe)-imidazoG37] synthetase (radical SAM superfamily)
MSDQETLIAFGPVPSRRLGQSLGVNNIPPKICTYSCIYCQIGRTLHYSHNRMEYHNQACIFEGVRKKIIKVEEQGRKIDYITFVPDGEPTLDINLGKEIELLRQLGRKIAVITNASLMGSDDVKEELCSADLVSVKMDTVSKDIWRNIDRPRRNFSLDTMLQGILDFSKYFDGELITETMLVKEVNDELEEISKVADYLAQVKHTKSYLSIPTRPPTERWVEPADEHTLSAAYALFSKMAIKTEYLIGYEGNEFAFTGDVERDILSITSVHPMRKDAVEEYLEKAHTDWHEIESLVEAEKLIKIPYKQELFYMRKLQ